jgi:hypothetical protein
MGLAKLWRKRTERMPHMARLVSPLPLSNAIQCQALLCAWRPKGTHACGTGHASRASSLVAHGLRCSAANAVGATTGPGSPPFPGLRAKGCENCHPAGAEAAVGTSQSRWACPSTEYPSAQRGMQVGESGTTDFRPHVYYVGSPGSALEPALVCEPMRSEFPSEGIGGGIPLHDWCR